MALDIPAKVSSEIFCAGRCSPSPSKSSAMANNCETLVYVDDAVEAFLMGPRVRSAVAGLEPGWA
jgi:hypothetical protein